MKKKRILLISLVCIITLIALPVAGCFGDDENGDTPTDQTPISQLQSDIIVLTTRVASLEGKVGTVSLTQLQSDVASIRSSLIALQSDVATITGTSTTSQSQLADLDDRVDDLITVVSDLEALLEALEIAPTTTHYLDVTVSLANPYIVLSIHSSVQRILAFEVVFTPTTPIKLDVSLASVNDALQWLYDPTDVTPPTPAGRPFITLTALTALTPTYNLYWDGSNWYLASVVFTTPATSVLAGLTTKQMLYSASVTTTLGWQVTVRPFPVGITGGGASW